MLNWIAVLAGGALGSALRYGLSLLLAGSAPLGTFLANVLGSFLLAFLSAYPWSPQGSSTTTRLLLTTGLCGGFTTYSTFNLETLEMLQGGLWQKGVAYAAGTLTCCLVAAACGLWLGRSLFPMTTDS